MQNAYYEQSVLFASLVDQQLRKTAFAISNYTGIHQDPFWLLWKTAMPAVLIELGFISNPADLKVLNSENGRNDIANKLFSAFKSFKTSYDSSLNAKTETSAPVQQTVAEQKPAPKEEQPAPQKTAEENVYYGVQIMGLGRLLKNGDPALKGLETQAVKSPDSSIYKYVVGKYSDREAAVKSLPAVKKKFPEAFPVKVEGTTVSRLR
jgi:N-acetylmuramoyl-L-alanine amidase